MSYHVSMSYHLKRILQKEKCKDFQEIINLQSMLCIHEEYEIL